MENPWFTQPISGHLNNLNFGMPNEIGNIFLAESSKRGRWSKIFKNGRVTRSSKYQNSRITMTQICHKGLFSKFSRFLRRHDQFWALDRYHTSYVTIRDRIEGRVTWGCVFFSEKLGKMCLFYTFLELFWKIDPLKTRFLDDSREVSGKFFHESKNFPELIFIVFFGHSFFENCQNFLKWRLRRRFWALCAQKLCLLSV